ncbi:MAG: transcriptional activator RfaH, partial [Proteobacteria bacterium]|nr:transcriptional activator RfaH [Pseudomonadota bacterium]
MKRWYVVHTHTRGEPLAVVNLRRQGLDAYLPQYSKRRRHARR